MLPAHLRGFSVDQIIPFPSGWAVAEGSTPVGPLVVTDDGRVQASVRRIVEGWRRLVDDPAPAPVAVHLSCDAAAAPIPGPDEDESYRLAIDGDGVRLHAPTSVGVRRGAETLLQLATIGSLPWGVIDDHPQFPWRGLLIDVSRHFVSFDGLRRVVDAMAVAKLNVLHLHLSDDQGFRVQSRVHPRLTDLGSDGRFYTQDEIRALVHHAARAGIRVVPEFDIPGHTTSWLVAHPELAATPGPFELRRQAGIAEVGLHPDKPEVLEFLRELFVEMAELFPDPYLHIGGDEVHPDAWPDHDAVPTQQRFTLAVVDIVESLGRTPVVWDEAWFPDLPATVLTQVWRGHGRLRAASASGRPVLFSTPYYLDHALDPRHHQVHPLTDRAGYAAARAALADDPRVGPVGAFLASQDASWEEGVDAPDRPDPAHVLGGEACMWSELVPEPLLNLRLWPAAAVVADVLWHDQIGLPVTDLEFDDDPRNPDFFTYALAQTTDVDVEADRLTHWLRLADGDLELAGHIATLATCCEPVKWYARHMALPDLRIDGPFDRFVDGLAPTRWWFNGQQPLARFRRAAAAIVATLGDPSALPARKGELVAVAERLLARCDAAEDPALPWPAEGPIGEVLVTWPERPA